MIEASKEIGVLACSVTTEIVELIKQRAGSGKALNGLALEQELKKFANAIVAQSEAAIAQKKRP